MPLPYLETLSGAARVAYPFIQRGVREGLSANEIYRGLRELGPTARRSTILDLVKAERTLVDYGQRLRYLPLDRRPDPLRVPEALTKQLRQYSYRVQVKGYIEGTNEPFLRFINVATTNIITRRQAQEAAEAAILADSTKYPWVIESMLIDNVTKAGGAGVQL